MANNCGIGNLAIPDIQNLAKLQRQLQAWNWPWPKI